MGEGGCSFWLGNSDKVICLLYFCNIYNEESEIMISKNRIKQIHSLGLKKFRDEQRLFVAEGPKVVGELLSVYSCVYVAALPEWLEAHSCDLNPLSGCTVDRVTQDELRKVSFLQHPQEVLAVFRQPDYEMPDADTLRQSLCIALDGVQDPGNVGTIIRLADWFGITRIFCSRHTADAFSPKVVQATMGALARIYIYNVDLPEWMESLPQDWPIYGTLLDGHNIYDSELQQCGLIVMGSEGRGISPRVAQMVNQRLLIPPFPEGRPTSESLNVAIATAVVCAEFRRRAVAVAVGNVCN